MRSLTTFPAIFPLLLVTLPGSALGIAIVSIRAFESEETKAKRLELKRQKELRQSRIELLLRFCIDPVEGVARRSRGLGS